MRTLHFFSRHPDEKLIANLHNYFASIETYGITGDDKFENQYS